MLDLMALGLTGATWLGAGTFGSPASGQGIPPAATPGGTEAAADQPSDDEPAPRAQTALDIDALLTDARVLDGRIDDPVWQLEPKPGRVDIMLPLRLTPPAHGSAKLTKPDVQLAGARFVAWWIPAPDAQNNNPSRALGSAATNGRSAPSYPQDSSAGQPETAQRFKAGDSRWARFLGKSQEITLNPGDDPTTRPARQAVAALDNFTSAAPQNLHPLAPRLARSITVSADGTVAWSTTRNISGAQIASSGENPYLYKLDSAKLREAAPPTPKRLTRNQGEDARTFSQRQRADKAAYRAARDTYRALQQQVRDLPEDFTEPLPPTVWAIFERTQGRRSFEFTGPAPLPWSVPTASFEQMREYAGQAGGGGRGGGGNGNDGFTPEELAAVAAFTDAMQNPHPLTARTIATVLSNSGLLARTKPGDPVSALSQKIFEAGDDDATRTLSWGLASVVPPTRGTSSLLAAAARTGNPFAKLASLRAALQTDSNRPGGIAQVVQRARNILFDPIGLDPEDVLASLIETADDSPEAFQALLAGVSFDGLPKERFDRAAAYVIRNASEPGSLCAAWLDQRLLGSSDPTTTTQTLQLLARAGAGSHIVAPFAASLRRHVFGPPTPAAQPHGGRPPAPLDLTVTDGIALTSTSHGLFKALQAGDPETRRLGWDAIRLFRIPASSQRNARNPNAAAGADDDPLEAILRAATSQPTTPASLVDFLVRQDDQQRATAALVRLAAQGDPRLASRAIMRLRNSQRPVAEALRDADPATRAGFAAALYLATRGDTPPVTKLAANDRVAQWLGTEIAQTGDVPPPAAWVQGAGGESQVMALAADPDDDLAHGALAALAASAGGDTVDQFAVIDALGAAPRSADVLKEQWPAQKTAIRIGKLAKAAGDYRLILEIRVNAPDAPANTAGGGFEEAYGGYDGAAPYAEPALPGVTAPDPDAQPVTITPQRIVLGIVQLGTEGDTVHLAGDAVTLTLPDDAFALRIEDPVQLRNFPNEDVQELPLDRATAPLDLLPASTGTWRGQTPLGATHTLIVTMEPAG